jgi:hypothetical protein
MDISMKKFFLVIMGGIMCPSIVLPMQSIVEEKKSKKLTLGQLRTEEIKQWAKNLYKQSEADFDKCLRDYEQRQQLNSMESELAIKISSRDHRHLRERAVFMRRELMGPNYKKRTQDHDDDAPRKRVRTESSSPSKKVKTVRYEWIESEKMPTEVEYDLLDRANQILRKPKK